MNDPANVTRLHVVPDVRGGWRVVEDGRSATLSEHASVTEAERMSWAHCRSLDACVIVVHDRYGRTRPAAAWTAPAMSEPDRSGGRVFRRPASGPTGQSASDQP
jgi:hypothetical protein